jgi:hypothetical protein
MLLVLLVLLLLLLLHVQMLLQLRVLDSFSQRIHRVVTLTFLKLIGSPFRFRPFDLIYAPPKAGI